MPPKKDQSSKKSEAKAKAKVIEDKTFGLKNKNKSAKVGEYIRKVEAQVQQSGNRKQSEQDAAARAELKEKKRLEELKKAELAALFKPVVQPQKIAPGTDPKTVLCQYFKVGQCTKGDRCKFSHDLTIERRATKINLYEDRRRDGEEGMDADGDVEGRPDDNMRSWDQSKLELVVQRKHHKNARTTTEIVCKFFLDALEKESYGWFWECPNGGDACKYRHALPPGFVMRTKATAAASSKRDGEEKISLEAFLESERYKIEKKTPVTVESFRKWKEDRKAKQDAEARLREKEKETQIRAGKMLHASGRDLFMYNPEAFLDGDDEEADADMDYTQRADDQEEQGADGASYDMDETAFMDESLENLDIGDDDESSDA